MRVLRETVARFVAFRAAGVDECRRFARMSVAEAVAFAAWCFAVALAGGLVGLVLGNIRLPAVLLLAASPASAGGANIAISGVAAATASVTHLRAGRINWRLFAWMAPPSVAGALVGGYLAGVVPDEAVLLGDRGRARLQRHRPAPAQAAAAAPPTTSSTYRAAVLSGAVIGLLGGFVGLILGALRMPALLRLVGEVPSRAVGHEPARRRARRHRRPDRPPSERRARPRHPPRRLRGLDPGRADRRAPDGPPVGGAADQGDRRRPARRRARPPQLRPSPRLRRMATTEDRRTDTPTEEWKRELYDAVPERQGELFSTISGLENEPLATPDTVDVDYDARPRLSRRLSVHARRLPVDVPRPPLDDAPVRRLRHRRGDERALPLPARPRPDRPLARRSTCRR